MKAVVTVIGADRTGIIARVSGLLYKHNVNILDISQTVMGELFAMIMLVETERSDLSFDGLIAALKEEGELMGVETRMQRYDIFEAMHKV